MSPQTEEMTAGLALPLTDDLRFEDWVELGKRLAHIERGVQWSLGAWWAFGLHRYGQRAEVAARGVFGRAYQTLRNYATVARRFETSRRGGLFDGAVEEIAA